jgi:hypothetical protein
MSIYWITVDGHLYGMDNREKGYRGRSRPRGVSATVPDGIFEELLELALAAREASRPWYDSNFPSPTDHGARYYRERARNADGACSAHVDGSDVSVNVRAGGVAYENECIGGQWAEFRRRFFALVDEALDPSAAQ